MEKNQVTEEIKDISFRDRLATIDSQGKRVWVYPKKPKGRLLFFRRIVAHMLLFFFYLAPHLKIDGEPMLLLNILERKFFIFGNPFYPQDFHLLVMAFITLVVFIILFTVIYGRIFCGWICPQTVFMEFLYRPIEYLIDGDRRQQQKLDKQEMNPVKFIKRLVKNLLFFTVSFITIITFWSYIIGYANVAVYLRGWPGENFPALFIILIFSSVHYFIFAWFREQVCTLVCPYGRLQGVMLDMNTILVAYDYKRGEPRGPLNKTTGDCINCRSCVDVCPTGIDIRNGTQLECINCTACIDSCNAVMKSIRKPTGLIRYTSEKSISERTQIKFNARAIAYSVVLAILLGIVGYLLAIRGEVETTIIRAQGTMFQNYGENAYSNLYNLQMVNKTRETVSADLKLIAPEGEIRIIGDSISAKEGEVAKRNLLIILNKREVKTSNIHIEIGVFIHGKLIDQIKSSFVGPNSLDTQNLEGRR